MSSLSNPLPPGKGSSLGAGGLNGDEALALRLQLEMDQEAAEAQTVELEDGGLFFCQICQRDLSHMTPEGRTHHLNRSQHLSCPLCPSAGIRKT